MSEISKNWPAPDCARALAGVSADISKSNATPPRIARGEDEAAAFHPRGGIETPLRTSSCSGRGWRIAVVPFSVLPFLSMIVLSEVTLIGSGNRAPGREQLPSKFGDYSKATGQHG